MRASALWLVLIAIAACVGLAAGSGPRQLKDKKKKGKQKQKKKVDSARVRDELTNAAVGNAKIMSQYDSLHKESQQIVDKHNKLVEDYNSLAAKYNDVLKKHSHLVEVHNKHIGAYNRVVKECNTYVDEIKHPSLGSFLAAKAYEAYHHPGIEGAANKTYIASPVILQGQIASQKWFNETQTNIHAVLQDLAGPNFGVVEPWLPAASGFLVYGLVFIPACSAMYCLAEFVCKVEQILPFGHIYIAVVATCACVFAGITGQDPLTTFYEHDAALYQFGQVVFAALFLVYGMVLCAAVCCTSSNGISVPRLVQLLIAVAFCIGYYLTVWTPAMVDEMPQVANLFPWLPSAMQVSVPYFIVIVAFGSSRFLEEGTGGEKVEPADAEQGKEK